MIMNIKIYKLVLSVILIINLLSCRNDFSSRRGGLDYIRLPFIKPYEALLTNGRKQWQMNLFNSALNSSVVNIKTVYVENGAILLYSEKTYLDGQDANQAWFVVVPAKHVEKGFSNENDFAEYLKSIGIRGKPILIDINKLSDYFNDHYPINWKTCIKDIDN
jgi:hypothetical protein